MLRQKSYLASRTLGTLSNSLFMFTVIWWFQTETDRSSTVGIMNALFSITASLAVIYGPFIDRHALKVVSVGALCMQTFIFLLLTLCIFKAKQMIYPILILATLASVCDEFFIPADRAIIKSVVKAERELTQLNSRISLIDQSTNFMGVALAGALLGFLVVAHVMALVTVLSFAGTLYLMFAIHKLVEPHKEKQQSDHYWQEVLTGYTYIKQDHFLFRYLFASTLYSFVTPMLIVFLPFIAKKMGSAIYYSGFYIAFFLGFMVGALLAGRLKPLVKTISLYWLLSSLPLLLILGARTNGVLIVLAIFLFGFTSSIQNILSETLIQIRTQSDFLGRVMTTFKTFYSIGGPVGSLLAGALLDHGQVQMLVIFSMVLIILGGLVLFLQQKERKIDL
ncbi:MFS transporter [Agrilactobacillus fermenti]|uniref:MFS transporter n=1 Tax=Agrilactobacillus fermenti TaxID=2586909 RepID=UPI001E65AB91|nr:MFS transporter [Agrilactobacillus fermenti]MCD2255734.1 MFS transporter [Agrilactobacillus fermenti]